MTNHVVKSTSELTALMKDAAMADTEKDGGFCSGADEDDMSSLHSPSASEDSVEVQVSPISLRNKRKLAEPRKIQEQYTAPLKKRRLEKFVDNAVADEEIGSATTTTSPFRPWSTIPPPAKSKDLKQIPPQTMVHTEQTTNSTPVATIVSASARNEDDSTVQIEDIRSEENTREELMSRLRDSEESESVTESTLKKAQRRHRQRLEDREVDVTRNLAHPSFPREEPLSLVLRGEVPRVPSHPAVSGSYDYAGTSFDRQIHPILSSAHPRSRHNNSGSSNGGSIAGGQPRNYKNMTRERRIEANARERTRVHTISAAFDTLRRAIPAYSHNQKLSKLSVLRIACSYIMTLSKIVESPKGSPVNGPDLGACVDLVSRTIQTEGKLRKRKED